MSGWRSELERLEDDLDQAQTATPYDPVTFAGALERLVEAAERRPQIAENFHVEELYDELSEAYEAVGRYEDALTAMEQAIAAGCRGEPDPRCRLAELHLRFGHPEPAHATFAQVKAETPGDVWLYNNAGLEYRRSGDLERALGWLDEGLELAMRTGDPERLVGQLSDLRRECLDGLGRAEDDLQRRAAAFEPPQRRPAPAACSPWWLPKTPPALAAAPAEPGLAERGGTQRGATDRGGKVATVGFAWFPAGEFSLALERWPDLVEGWGVSDFSAYSRETQRRMLRYAEDPDGRRLSIKVAPVVLSAYLPWCDERDEDPGAAPTRASYAAERVRLAAEGVVAWPPARNDRCWCGSGRKYKQCCGTVRLGPDEQ